jgi:hypothetical protein
MTMALTQPDKPECRNLDPFITTAFLDRLKNKSSFMLLLMVPAFTVMIVLVAAIEGDLGGPGDIRLSADFPRFFRLQDHAYSPPKFPLLRDYLTWFLALVIVATAVITHYQWKLISYSLSTLCGNGALKIKKKPQKSLLSKALKLDPLIDSGPPKTLLARLVDRTDESFRFAERWHFVLSVLAAIIALALVMAESQGGLFSVLTPHDANSHNWSERAYTSWWASIHHPIGLILYFGLAMIGAYVILLQNTVGIIIAYFAVSLPIVAELDADWLNRDGKFGWLTAGRLFRITFWSLAMHGVTISVILISIGIENFPWMIGLVALWVTVAAAYLIGPWWAFHPVERQARARRIAALEEQMCRIGIDPIENPAAGAPYIAEIERVNAASIKPLRVRSGALPTFAVAVLLPIVLTLAQMFY